MEVTTTGARAVLRRMSSLGSLTSLTSRGTKVAPTEPGMKTRGAKNTRNTRGSGTVYDSNGRPDDTVMQNEALRQEVVSLKTQLEEERREKERLQEENKLLRAEKEAMHGGPSHGEQLLPPGLRGFDPISKHPRIVQDVAGLGEAEAAFASEPSEKSAEQLRAKAELVGATMRDVIDETLKKTRIVSLCDAAIQAGAETFRGIYEAVYHLITERESLEPLSRELDGLTEVLERRPLQHSHKLVDVYADAVATRKPATELIKKVCNNCEATPPAKQTALKSTYRIIEKSQMRAGDGRGRCAPPLTALGSMGGSLLE